jgi:hypothetical protein
MCPGKLTKVFGLWSIIRLPTLTEGMIHTVVSEIIVFKVEVVEIIDSWLYFLTMHHSNQLWLSIFVSH